MLKQDQTVTQQWDTAVNIESTSTANKIENIAVSICNVTKTFEQWQRTGQGKNIIKNLLKPEKKVITALDDITFSVARGEFVAYAGPNGAGKSTTMKLLSGMLQPASGEIKVLGMSPQKDRIALMKRVGYYLETELNYGGTIQ
jgi:ABC-type uncharacterized transport system ATPase subunit